MGDMVLLMVYFTDGFFDWAKFFLRTLKHSNGERHDLIACTVGLTPQQIDELKSLYGPMLVLNQPYDLMHLSRASGLTTAELMRQKDAIEKGYVTKGTRCWKLMHAGDQRVDFVNIAYCHAAIQKYSHLICFDVDTYFRGSLDPLIQEAYEYDALLKLRLNNPVPKARITIDLMVFSTGNEYVHSFISEWQQQIAHVPPYQRPIGFGQLSCLYAYEAYESKLRFGNVPLEYGLPGALREGQLIWTGNIHKKTKVEVLKTFEDDFSIGVRIDPTRHDSSGR